MPNYNYIKSSKKIFSEIQLGNRENIKELLKHYPQNCFTKETLSEDECYVLNCNRRHWEEKNEEPNFLLRLLYVYAFQNYDDEDGKPFDERGYTKDDFVFKHPNFEKMLLNFIEGCSEKYLKKFVTNIKLKDYLCHVLDKQSNRSREAIFGLWIVVKKYKNIGLITDSEYNVPFLINQIILINVINS